MEMSINQWSYTRHTQS